MKTHAIAVTRTVTITIALFAQQLCAQSVAAKFPYLGQVTGTNVYVRSGPGEKDGRSNYYPCTKVSRPARVTVVGARNGWLEILAPPGTYSVVYAQYVDADQDGKTGVVNANDVRIRAGGVLHESNYWQPHGRLNKGDRVEIIGKVQDQFGQWYKIKPPDEAHFWIYGAYVQPVSNTERAAEPKPVAVAAPAPSVPEPTATSLVEEPAGQPATTQPVDTAALLEQIKQIEAELRAEYEKPADQRNFKALLEKYKKIRVPRDSFARPWLEARIAFLTKEIQKRQQLQAVESLMLRTEAQQKLIELERQRIEMEAQAKGAARKPFAAEGVLVPSELFVGNHATPRRFLLRDPDTFRIRAYVQCTSGALDLSRFENMYVGVYGPKHYDSRVALDVVEAESVVVLKTDVQAKSPAQPVIKPRALPAPQPAEEQPPAQQPVQPPSPAEQVPAEIEPQGAAQLELEPVQPSEQPGVKEPAPPQEPEAPEAAAPPQEAPVPQEPAIIKPARGPEPQPRPAVPEQPAVPETIVPQPQEPAVIVPSGPPIEIPAPTRPATGPAELEPAAPTVRPAAPVTTAPATAPSVEPGEPTTKPAQSTGVTAEPTPQPRSSPEPVEPEHAPATNPGARRMDPLPPTGLPMVPNTAVTSALDEREYE